ncbi:methyltransferase [Tateyamaria sp. ANG-S1]|uniref:class I SAM-dependent methyltransferase n=1 Tax=Tateyamaria sp. ANG-S1 TaxID=1577905 RepID=UPI00057F326E|nr:methyltransferase [Tateyamaria sp. ANG-S1]KIC51905.1 MFS transporter [Tateyamaria sp. ANG-S1]
MLGDRLPLALDAMDAWGDGPVAVLHPPEDADLSALPKENVHIVSPLVTVCQRFEQMGYTVSPELPKDTRFAASIACLTRARAEAQALVAAAAAQTEGPVIVDGQKTDGADSMLKALRQRADVSAPISKAHGKIYWFAGGTDVTDWARGPELHPGGFWTAPGVFSADGVDPASALLVEALPETMVGTVADLGAGWGYLSAHLLTRDVQTVHLVEAHDMALQCARHNVTDDRAQFHWADATTWTPPEKVDAVVMNPPFHKTRSADPSIGRAFITNAARILRPHGALWMVANRHLPYEDTLASNFAKVVELDGDARFKLVRAERPRQRKR